MKLKLFLYTFLLIASFVFPFEAGAIGPVDIGDFSYVLGAEDLTATVLGRAYTNSKDLVIPRSVKYEGKEYTVTEIANMAFFQDNTFKGTLTIPNSVTYIGNWAFAYCSFLTGSLTIPNSVTYIGESAFYKCSGFNGSLTIPEGVTSIGKSAFFGC